MIELISLIAKSLVKQPDAVSVTMVQKGNVEAVSIHISEPTRLGMISYAVFCLKKKKKKKKKKSLYHASKLVNITA